MIMTAINPASSRVIEGTAAGTLTLDVEKQGTLVREHRVRPYSHILVPLDGSEVAEQVLPHVELLAEKFGSRITLVRTIASIEADYVVSKTARCRADHHAQWAPATLDAEIRENAIRYLDAIAARLCGAGLDVDYVYPQARPGKVIVEEAQNRGVDLIAMTTHGRSGVGRLVYGSVAEEVLRHAHCPVLLIRAHGGA